MSLLQFRRSRVRLRKAASVFQTWSPEADAAVTSLALCVVFSSQLVMALSFATVTKYASLLMTVVMTSMNSDAMVIYQTMSSCICIL